MFEKLSSHCKEKKSEVMMEGEREIKMKRERERIYITYCVKNVINFKK